MKDLWREIERLPPAKRRLLAELMEEEGLAPESGKAAPEPPRNELEERLLELWSHELGAERIGIRDDLFRLGGDSIQVLRVVARARRHGIPLTTQLVFAHPTVAALAEALRERGEDGAPSERVAEAPPFAQAGLPEDELAELLAREEGEVEDVYRLTPLQDGMLFHVLSADDPEVYRDQGVCRLDGPLDPESFRCAWEALVARHAALRTSVRWRGLSRPVQVIHGAVPLPLDLHDWRRVAREEQERRIEERLARDRLAPLDLEAPPLFRLTLLRLADDEHRLLWTHHHLAHDAWSLEVLVRELLALYRGGRDGGAPTLPPAPRFAAYLAWLERRDRAAAPEAAAEVPGRAAPPPPLPGDLGAAAGPPDFTHHEEPLEPAEGEALRRRARALGVTVGTLVQAAWALVLTHGRERSEAVYGTVVAGRPADLAGADRMVGLFINTLPLRVTVDPAAALEPWLHQVQTAVAELEAAAATPLAELRARAGLGPEAALFEAVLVVQNAFLAPPEAAGLAIRDLRLEGHSHYPLMLRVTPERRIRLELLWDRGRFGARRGEQVLGRFRTLLALLAAEDAPTVGDLVARLNDAEAADRRRRREGWRRAARAGLRTLGTRRTDAPSPKPDRRTPEEEMP